MRVESEGDVDRDAAALTVVGVEVSVPRLFPEYAVDYSAVFLTHPDGVRLEITNLRKERMEQRDSPAG